MAFSIRSHRYLPTAYWAILLSVVILLLLSSGPGYAEWVALEKEYQSPGLRMVYIDPSTIRREGNQVTLWLLIDYKSMQGNIGMGSLGFGPNRFFSTKTQKQFDCANKRVRLLKSTNFSSHMGTGEANAGYVNQDIWLSIEPNSLNQGLWEVACANM